MPRLVDGIMVDKFWKNLASISETSLKGDEIDFSAEKCLYAFYRNHGKRYIDDYFYVSLKRQINSLEEVKKANRLFLFYEALHCKKHKLTTQQLIT